MRAFLLSVSSALILGLALLSRSVPAGASEGCPNDCWVHVYGDEEYSEGNAHTVICGPAELPNLEKLNGKDWGDQIDSVKVGGTATVDAWKDKNYQDTKISFAAGQSYPSLGELGFHDDIGSMKVQCK
jgi:hypothetical protein